MDKWYMHRRAQDCILQSYLTNSKRPESLIKGITPTHVARGRGGFLWDHQGKKYLDFICGLGTNLVGYAHPKVNAAMTKAMDDGASHSLATHYELDAAEKLKELFPFVKAVKWLKTGSDACLAAIKIARAKTGRTWVLSEGYHGWGDSFVSLTAPALGVPPDQHISAWDQNVESLSNIAAVIVEPIITDTSLERLEWLKQLREDCTKHGVLLIFDEIITGFRWPSFSVANHYGITPDLICLGKAIASGMPLAAVGATAGIALDLPEYFISSTYAGETLSLAAAIATMSLLQREFQIAWLWSNGQAFLDKFNAIFPEGIWLEGYPSRSVFRGDELVRALFFQECARAGILVGPSFWMNFPLIDEAKNALVSMEAILGRIKRGEVELAGEMPSSPFAQKMREQQ